MSKHKDMTTEEARSNVGRRVVYRPHPGGEEVGTITGANDRYVFVRYQGDSQAKATPAGSLSFIQG
jgi:hypothetical protein